jgi:hypothetical protein
MAASATGEGRYRSMMSVLITNHEIMRRRISASDMVDWLGQTQSSQAGLN